MARSFAVSLGPDNEGLDLADFTLRVWHDENGDAMDVDSNPWTWTEVATRGRYKIDLPDAEARRGFGYELFHTATGTPWTTGHIPPLPLNEQETADSFNLAPQNSAAIGSLYNTIYRNTILSLSGMWWSPLGWGADLDISVTGTPLAAGQNVLIGVDHVETDFYLQFLIEHDGNDWVITPDGTSEVGWGGGFIFLDISDNGQDVPALEITVTPTQPSGRTGTIHFPGIVRGSRETFNSMIVTHDGTCIPYGAGRLTTNPLDADWADGGRLDTLLDAAAAGGGGGGGTGSPSGAKFFTTED